MHRSSFSQKESYCADLASNLSKSGVLRQTIKMCTGARSHKRNRTVPIWLQICQNLGFSAKPSKCAQELVLTKGILTVPIWGQICQNLGSSAKASKCGQELVFKEGILTVPNWVQICQNLRLSAKASKCDQGLVFKKEIMPNLEQLFICSIPYMFLYIAQMRCGPKPTPLSQHTYVLA